jgi:hypothetical protein
MRSQASITCRKILPCPSLPGIDLRQDPELNSAPGLKPKFDFVLSAIGGKLEHFSVRKAASAGPDGAAVTRDSPSAQVRGATDGACRH